MKPGWFIGKATEHIWLENMWGLYDIFGKVNGGNMVCQGKLEGQADTSRQTIGLVRRMPQYPKMKKSNWIAQIWVKELMSQQGIEKMIPNNDKKFEKEVMNQKTDELQADLSICDRKHWFYYP